MPNEKSSTPDGKRGNGSGDVGSADVYGGQTMRRFSLCVLSFWAAALTALACGTSEDSGFRPDGGVGGIDGGPSGNLDGQANSDAHDDRAAADAGPWTPKQLSGLALWLDDTVGIVRDPGNGARVVRWLDQSGRGHDATAEESNGELPSLDSAAITGKDAVLCDKQTYLRVEDSADLQFATGDWAIVMVAKFGIAVGLSGPLLYEKGSGTGLVVSVNGSGNVGVLTYGAGGGSAAVANVASDAFHIMSVRGKDLEVRAAGNVANGASTSDVSAPGEGIRLCGSAISSIYTELVELIVVKGTMTDEDLAKTEAYLKTKFGL